MPQVFNRLRDLALEQGIIEPEQGRKPDCKLKYYVNDESVCKSAFASLHFMGTNPRLATLLKAVFEAKLAAPIDVRYITKKPGTTPSPKSGEVYSYLESLYHSVAESLPDDTEADFKPHHVAAPESDDELAEQANIIIRGGNRSTLGSLKDSGVRYLPPGSLYDQYKQYLALEFPHVSFNTFISVWKKDFPNLQFRGKRQHAICATCTRDRLLIKALPVTARLKQRLLYERHLADQYHDRQQYWQIRAASRTTAQNVAQNVGCENRTLALIIDSVDQQKFSWPRARFLLSKDFGTFNRPRLHCTAVIVHGWGVWTFISHSDIRMCGSSTVEMLSYVFSELQEAGCPLHTMNVNIQMDNTSTTNKNATVFSWMGACVSMGICRTMCASFLRTGHTHED